VCKLQFLDKIEALEDKIKAEMATLKEKMVKMEEEIETFSDLDKLRREAEEKRRYSRCLPFYYFLFFT
jgi:hypothetical protein